MNKNKKELTDEEKEIRKKKIFIGLCSAATVVVILVIILFSVWKGTEVKLSDVIDIPIYYLDAEASVVVDRTADYLAHPDLVLTDRGELITVYPAGHGKGEIILKRSTDFGKTWSHRDTGLPSSWVDSKETPCIYSIKMHSGAEKLILTSGCPEWQGDKANGFNCSYSDDGGNNWSEFENWYGRDWAESTGKKAFDCIVAMSSLTQVQENGFWVNKWLGTFHDHDFNIYKTYLTIDYNGELEWSEPELLLGEYNSIAQEHNLCEPEIIRLSSDELVLIMRENKHEVGSMISVSRDEGNTWSKPRALPNCLTGDRHKAEYDPVSGKWIITFRQVLGIKPNALSTSKIYGIGWVAWVGGEDTLLALAEGDTSKGRGDAFIVLAEHYRRRANLDCGYAGTATDGEGNFVLISYGSFSKSSVNPYILSVSFNLPEILEEIQA